MRGCRQGVVAHRPSAGPAGAACRIWQVRPASGVTHGWRRSEVTLPCAGRPADISKARRHVQSDHPLAQRGQHSAKEMQRPGMAAARYADRAPRPDRVPAFAQSPNQSRAGPRLTRGTSGASFALAGSPRVSSRASRYRWAGARSYAVRLLNLRANRWWAPMSPASSRRANGSVESIPMGSSRAETLPCNEMTPAVGSSQSSGSVRKVASNSGKSKSQWQ